jgi:drug/metabolite transporter (DMT)-like permease
LLVLDLPVALMLSSLLLHSRMRPREWAATATMAAGLAGLLLSLSPSGGSNTGVSGQTWALAASANVLLIAAGVWWARLTGQGARKAAILGTATSCGFGLTAALIKGVTATFSQGFTALFTSWQLYAMIVAGAGSMFLLQSAVHAGRLLAAQPGLSLGDPVISILWGTLVFEEQVRGGPFIALAAVAAVAVGAAVVVLAHSPLLNGDAGSAGESEKGHGG